MQPPTPTKNHRPATKARTFVHANGALLAEQEVIEYQQTPYEILRFVHQDASGTGVQQTLANGTLALPNGRTAEYDAMGRNVADPGPYVTLNTQLPSENGSGIDLFGNGEGYRPGRVTYTYHGMVVPESFARQFINSGEIGGAFGLLFMAAQMSRRIEGWRRLPRAFNGRPTLNGTGGQQAIPAPGNPYNILGYTAIETDEGTVFDFYEPIFNDSWSTIASIIPLMSEAPQDTPCNRMAAFLGSLINDYISEIGGTRGITSHGQLDAVMNAVDGAFTPFYTGWNGTINTANRDGGAVAPSSGGLERRPPWGGHPGGFKDQYIDNVDKTGQTHHFAAYFSAGINGVSGAVKALGHAALTDLNNQNDLNLSVAAFDFGSSLKKSQSLEMTPHPNRAPRLLDEPVSSRLARFRRLGEEVRRELCK